MKDTGALGSHAGNRGVQRGVDLRSDRLMTMRAYRTLFFRPALAVSAFLFATVAPAVAQGPTKLTGAKPAGTTPAAAAKTAPGTGAFKMDLPPVPPGSGITFESKVGSLKILGSDTVPVEGTLDINFTGTVLISQMDPTSNVTTSGSVRKEYTTKDGSKILYFGSGKLHLVGKMRAFQFFGRDLSGHYDGYGIFRFYGEFDKNLDTGNYWYDNDPHRPWGTGGMQIPVPNPGTTGESAQVKIHKG